MSEQKDKYSLIYLDSDRANITPYERLANAIIIKAVIDYERALAPTPPSQRYKKRRQEKYRERRRLEEFFGSSWYYTLTSIEPDVILKNVFSHKRSKTVRRWVKLVNRSKKPIRPELEPWQKREIRLKRRGYAKRQTTRAHGIASKQ